MLKKLLCVMISALMVISVLPVGVFAADTVEIDGTTYEVIFSEDVSVASGNWNTFTLSSSSSFLTALQTSGAYLVITRDSSASGASYDNMKLGDTWYSGTSATMDLSSPDIGSGTVVGFLASDVYTEWVDGGNSNAGDPLLISNTAASYTITNISVVTDSSSTGATDSFENATVIFSQTSLDGNFPILECLNESGINYEDSDQYLLIYYTYTYADDTYVGYEPCAIYDANWNALVGGGTSYKGYFGCTKEGGYFSISLTELASIFNTYEPFDWSSILLNWWGDDYASFVKADVVDLSPDSTSRMTGAIYVNEDYHAFIINGHFLCVPHTVDSYGYCTVCKEYIGTDDAEATTVTVDGVDYVEAFVYDTAIASGNWNKVTIGDSTLAVALNTEGAILQVTRDTETVTSYADSEYDKFMLGKDDSSYVQLSTAGTTTEDESGLVAYVSDDGTVVTYNGATVYAALSDAGLADLSSYVLISNTSASYNITSIKVLIPVGTVVTETVDVDEPAEDTNSETEDDELDVDEADAEEVTETNPTTGAVLALVPMAIAGFAVVASKRR